MRRLVFVVPALALAWACSSSSSDDTGGSGGGGSDGGSDAVAPPGAGDDGGGGGGDGGGDSGPPEIPLVAPVSGTRLEARFDAYASGVSVFKDIFDTTTNEPCYEGTTEDGKTRCVPNALTTPYFSDMGCSTRIASAYGGSCTPTYAQVDMRDPAACTGGTAYYKLGAVYTGTVWRSSFAGCVQVTPGPNDVFYTLGAASPATDFEEVATQLVPITTGASARVTTAADGLRVWHGALWDPVTNVSASVTLAGDDKPRVLPYARLVVNKYKAGMTCNMALASGYEACGSLPSGLAAFQPTLFGGMPPHTQLYPIGAEFFGQVYNPNQMCAATAPDANEHVYQLGAEIPPSTFPEAVPVTPGDAKLVAKTYQVAGHTIPPLRAFDVPTNVSCTVLTAADGKRRCFPDFAATPFYTDMTCTTRIFGQYSGGTVPPYGLAPDAASCNATYHLYALGAITTPANVWTKNASGGCDPASKIALAFYAEGAEVAPATLAEATLVQ